MIKKENEITVRVQCSKEILMEQLKKEKINMEKRYNYRDIYLIPEKINIKDENSREILKYAIILREFSGDINRKTITYKSKNIESKGAITSQYSINCEILNIDDALNLFKHIGYKELMVIDEEDFQFKKDNFEFAVKVISDDNILIEAETNKYYENVEKLKNKMNEINISFDKSNYFVKKAEEELNKIKSS